MEKTGSNEAQRPCSYRAEIDSLQFYSDKSKSPIRTPDPVASIFRRPMTPISLGQMKKSYFIQTTADKFKNVWVDKLCL